MTCITLVQQFNYITVGISLNYANATVDNIIITMAVYLCVIFVGVLLVYIYIYIPVDGVKNNNLSTGLI